MIYILLFICCYWGLIRDFLMDLTPVIVVFLFLATVFQFIKRTPFKKYNISILLFIVINWGCILILGLTHNYTYATFEKGITQYILFPLVFIAVCEQASRVNYTHLFKYLAILNIPNLIGSFYEHISGNYILTTSHVQYLQDGAIRTAAFVGDMISLPLILGYCVLTLLYLGISTKNPIYYISSIAYAIGTFLSQSRGPFMAMLIGTIVMLILLSNKRSTKSIFGKKSIITTSLIVLLLWGAYYIIVQTTILDNTFLFDFAERIRTIFIWDNSNGDASNATRVEIWLNMFDLFLANPWYGIGIGTTGSDRLVTIGATESALIKRLVELGIVGMTINLVMYFVMLKTALFNIRKTYNIKDKEIKIVLFSIVVVVLIEGIVLQIDEYFPATTFMWISMSYLCTKSRIAKQC